MRQAIGYIVCGGFSVLFGRWVVLALATGEARGRRGGTVLLAEDPVTFWMFVAWDAFFMLICLFPFFRTAMADLKRLRAS